MCLPSEPEKSTDQIRAAVGGLWNEQVTLELEASYCWKWRGQVVELIVWILGVGAVYELP